MDPPADVCDRFEVLGTVYEGSTGGRRCRGLSIISTGFLIDALFDRFWGLKASGCRFSGFAGLTLQSASALSGP